MESKILVLVQNMKKSDLLIAWLSKEVPCLEFLTYDYLEELPLVYDAGLYSGLFFIVEKVTVNEIDYFRKLRSLQNQHYLCILGKVVSDKVFSLAKDIKQCEILESSEYFQEQLKFYMTNFITALTKTINQQQLLGNYQTLITENPNSIITLDDQGKITEANKHFLMEFGYYSQDLTGLSIHSIIPEFETDQLTPLISIDSKDSFDLAKIMVLNKAGELHPYSVHVTIGFSYGSRQIYLILKNLTALNAQEQIIDDSADTYNLLSRIIEDLAVTLSSDLKNVQLLKEVSDLLKCDEVLIYDFKSKDEFRRWLFSAKENDRLNALFKKNNSLIYENFQKGKVDIFYLTEEDALGRENITTFFLIPFFTGGRLYGAIIAIYKTKINADEYRLHLGEILGKVCAVALAKNRYVAELSISEKHFKDLVENAQDGIYQSTPDGKIIYANEALVKMLGYRSFEEMSELCQASDLYVDPRHRDDFKLAIENNRVLRNFSIKLRTKSGDELLVMENTHLVTRFDGIVLYEGIIRNFTEYENLKENLKATRNFADELIEKANIIIAAFDKARKIIIWNQKAEEVTGYSKAEMIGHSDFLEKLHPVALGFSENFNFFNQSHHDTTNTPQLLSCRAKNGEERVIGWTQMDLFTLDHGNLNISFGVDLTETRKLEDKLLETQKMEIFAVIASKIAHSFDEVITHIISNLADIKEESHNPLKIKEIIHRVESSLRIGSQLTRQLLSITKKSEAAFRIINPNDLLEQAIMLLRQTCPDNIHVKYELQAHDFIDGEPAQLYQAILNIAINAIEALPEGGQISVTTESVNIKHSRHFANVVTKQNDYLLVKIADNGMGMSSDILKRIFEPFFSTRQDSKTRGIGLTLARKIIHDHHGFLFIESKEFEGTTAFVYLPKRKKTEILAKPVIAPTSLDAKKWKSVMIVDDEAIIRDLIEDVLSVHGYQVFSAADGFEALKIFELRSQSIDLVILDMIMPQMDGREVFYKIKQLNPNIKIVITSGFSKPNVKEELIGQGADGFLPKPFTIATLTELVENILS